MIDQFSETLRGRASVRSFSPEPIDPEIVRRAIDLAGWAPSPHGTQPWRFAVVESQAERQRLATAMAVSWEQQLALDGDDPAIIAHRSRRSQERLTTAPVVVVLCLDLSRAHTYPDRARSEAEELMAIQSLGAAAQNFLLAIHAQGLAAGWMCAPLFCPDLVRETLDLPDHLVPHAMFPVGQMDQPPKRRPRVPVDDLIAAWR